jgi:integrase/recombinase XerC
VKRETEPYVYRRHARDCEYFGANGRSVRADKCRCPFHADGIFQRRRIRQSLKTRSRQLADRRLSDLLKKIKESTTDEPIEVTVAQAAARFLQSYGELLPNREYRGIGEYATWRKYRTKLRLLEAFCATNDIKLLSDISVEVLEDYRRSRSIVQLTWKVELQALRTFFRFCVSRRWISSNPASEVRSPRNIKPNEVVPYTLVDESRILAACDEIGGSSYQRSEANYERRRAKAMIMILRHTALRVSDVCTLRRDAISWDESAGRWRILVRTQKSGEPVFLPIPSELELLLDSLPRPRKAAADCPYYFWNGITSRRAVVGIAERTLAAVFRKSRVKDAHAHRFRHTLATRLLAGGATYEQVADILGNSPEVVRKHYAKWSQGRQDNIDRLMTQHFSTGAVTTPVTFQSHKN